MNQIVSLFMFSCGDYEKVKQDVWEGNWKAMRLYSVVALVAFGVITLVSVFSLSIGNFKWVYLVYTFLSLVYFCISRCQLRSFFGKKLVVYSFFAALLLFGIITGTLITPEEITVNYIVFMVAAPLLFTARTAVMIERKIFFGIRAAAAVPVPSRHGVYPRPADGAGVGHRLLRGDPACQKSAPSSKPRASKPVERRA